MEPPGASLRALYDEWAPNYPPEAHNPLMRIEQAAMLRLLPPVRGLRALDLACGTGRYSRILTDRGAASITALDFSWRMLAGLRSQPVSLRPVRAPLKSIWLLRRRATTNENSLLPGGEGAGMRESSLTQTSLVAHSAPRAARLCASMLDLPLRAATFDLVISGLAVGHAADLHRWLSEAARVLRPGGALLYSDFHPFAKQAGWQRTFRAADGGTRSLPFHAHEPAAHVDAAAALGLRIAALEELRVGVELTESFPGSRDFYRRWRGKPIILVALLHKP